MENLFGQVTWLDIIIVGVILFYAVEGYLEGGIHALFGFIKFVVSYLFGLQFYNLFANLILHWINMPRGLAKAAGFFLAISLAEIILHFLLAPLVVYATNKLNGIGNRINRWMGFVLGGLSGILFLMVTLSIILSLPLAPGLKKAVSQSRIAQLLVSQTQGLESKFNNVFAEASQDTLNFLTVKPESNSLVKLNFTASGTVDTAAEEQMLVMVNNERAKQGLQPLIENDALRAVARAHAQDMLTRGYFSHYTPEGLSPFDRMNNAGITYQYAGENLALAPDVNVAMQGLMNSPGHRANILYVHFGKAGIGVIDGGIYGEMFVQEFTD